MMYQRARIGDERLSIMESKRDTALLQKLFLSSCLPLFVNFFCVCVYEHVIQKSEGNHVQTKRAGETKVVFVFLLRGGG